MVSESVLPGKQQHQECALVVNCVKQKVLEQYDLQYVILFEF